MNQNDTQQVALEERQALARCSAQLGQDPLQIQGAGGNTSVKQGDTMWIKASGKWLMHATQEPLFVPVQRPALLDAMQNGDPRAEKSVDFVIDALNPQGLRPSIETSLHAALNYRVVIHVHCVDTIAVAIRQAAERQLQSLLDGFHWKFIPYVRPGLPLSTSILSIIDDRTDVLVLGNHGLVVAADTVDDCLALLQRVRYAIAQNARDIALHLQNASIDELNNHSQQQFEERLEGSDYVLAEDPAIQTLAFDDIGLTIAAGGSLYPDHVIFLGRGCAIADDGESAVSVVERYSSAEDKTPVSIIFPKMGIVVLKTATSGQLAMVRCLSDVCSRVPEHTPINYLNDNDHHQLLNWEAEQYRQALNQQNI